MDKRKAKRLDVECLVTIKDAFPKTPSSQTYSKCMDISPAGIKIYSHENLEIDTMVNLDIHLRKSNVNREVIGKIKWKDYVKENDIYQYGIEFLEDNINLENFLNSLEKLDVAKR